MGWKYAVANLTLQQVFGPVETARTERLSQRLLELASQPKPKAAEKEAAMEVDGRLSIAV